MPSEAIEVDVRLPPAAPVSVEVSVGDTGFAASTVHVFSPVLVQVNATELSAPSESNSFRSDVKELPIVASEGRLAAIDAEVAAVGVPVTFERLTARGDEVSTVPSDETDQALR